MYTHCIGNTDVLFLEINLLLLIYNLSGKDAVRWLYNHLHAETLHLNYLS